MVKIYLVTSSNVYDFVDCIVKAFVKEAEAKEYCSQLITEEKDIGYTYDIEELEVQD